MPAAQSRFENDLQLQQQLVVSGGKNGSVEFDVRLSSRGRSTGRGARESVERATQTLNIVIRPALSGYGVGVT